MVVAQEPIQTLHLVSHELTPLDAGRLGVNLFQLRGLEGLDAVSDPALEFVVEILSLDVLEVRVLKGGIQFTHVLARGRIPHHVVVSQALELDQHFVDVGDIRQVGFLGLGSRGALHLDVEYNVRHEILVRDGFLLGGFQEIELSRALSKGCPRRARRGPKDPRAWHPSAVKVRHCLPLDQVLSTVVTHVVKRRMGGGMILARPPGNQAVDLVLHRGAFVALPVDHVVLESLGLDIRPYWLAAGPGKMVEVPASVASDAPKEDNVGVIQEFWRNGRDRVGTAILLSQLFFLASRLLLGKGRAGLAAILAQLACAVLGGIFVLAAIDVDAESALQDKVFVPNLGDEMVSRTSDSEAVLVVREAASLAVHNLTALL